MTYRAAVIGNPIDHSLSPLIHHHWLQEFNIDGQYDKVSYPIEGQAFEAGIQALMQRGYRGVNVTLPFKKRAFELADTYGEDAQILSVANTLTFEAGKIHADNTDAIGFEQAMIETAKHSKLNYQGKKALVIGAGGAAPAVILALYHQGIIDITIVNRTVDKITSIVNKFNNHFGREINFSSAKYEELSNEMLKADIIINCSSLGMGDSQLPCILPLQCKAQLVADIIYAPAKTKLLQQAENLGIPTMNGLPMLLHQAVPGHQKWFGTSPIVTEKLAQICQKAALS